MLSKNHYEYECGQRTPQIYGIEHPKWRYIEKNIAHRSSTYGRDKTYHKSSEQIELFGRCQSDAAYGKSECSQYFDNIHETYVCNISIACNDNPKTNV